MEKLSDEAKEQIEVAAADQEARIQRAIVASLGGLIPAVATVVGDAPTKMDKFPGWEARAQRASSAFVLSAIGAVRDEVRQDEAVAKLKRRFLGTMPNHRIVRGEILGVYTKRGAGVLFTQSPFTPKAERLDPEVALERAKRAVEEKDSDTFKAPFDGKPGGALGEKGIERFWLGLRSDEDCAVVYRAALANVGKMCRIYKVIEENDDGKKRKLAKFVEPVAGYEHAVDDEVEDMLEQAEDYANTAGEQSDGFESASSSEFDDPPTSEFDDPVSEFDDAPGGALPTTPGDFPDWAKSHGFGKADLDAARERTGITTPFRGLSADDFEVICKDMLKVASA